MNNLAPSICSSVDDTLGPWAGQCRGGFDFTLLFEESILAIPLLSIFLLVLPFRLFQLGRQDTKTISSPLKIYKVVWNPFLSSLWTQICDRTDFSGSDYNGFLDGMPISFAHHLDVTFLKLHVLPHSSNDPHSYVVVCGCPRLHNSVMV